MADYFDAAGFVILPITAQHALADVEPVPPTRDPFDRLLRAQCAVEGLSLLTLDGALRIHASQRRSLEGTYHLKSEKPPRSTPPRSTASRARGAISASRSAA